MVSERRRTEIRDNKGLGGRQKRNETGDAKELNEIHRNCAEKKLSLEGLKVDEIN